MGFTNGESCFLALPTRKKKERYSKEEIKETSRCFWLRGSKQEYWSRLPFPSPIIIKIFKNKTSYYKLGQIKNDESFLKECIYLSVLKG